MSRMGSGDAIVVKPSNNIYTVLALVALIGAICSLAIIYVRVWQHLIFRFFPSQNIYPRSTRRFRRVIAFCSQAARGL